MRPVAIGRSMGDGKAWLQAAMDEIERASHEERFVQIADAYTVSNFTPTRTLDAGTATAADIADFLATLITDLKLGQVKRD